MGVVLGSGEYRYEVIEGWGKLPDDWTFHEVAAVAVDQKDQVYCFTRGKHPVIVFDRDGNFLALLGRRRLQARARRDHRRRRHDLSHRRRRSHGASSARSTEKFF